MVESAKSESSSSSAGPAGSASANGGTAVREAPRSVRPSRSRPDVDVPALLGKAAHLLATLVRLVCLLAAVILVVYVLLFCFDANPANPYTMFVGEWGQRLNLGLDTLFQPAEPKLAVLVNYGIAAIAWLVIGAIAGKLLRRAG